MDRVDLAIWARKALAHAEISQGELGRRLSKVLNRRVDPATVNKMLMVDTNNPLARRIFVDELAAIAQITGYPLPIALRQEARVPFLTLNTEIGPDDPGDYGPRETTAALSLGEGEWIAHRVEDDAMNCVSPRGSILFVDQSDTIPANGKYYLFWLRDELLYRRWHADPQYLAPYSTNPEHKPIFFKAKQLEVWGRVVRTMFEL